MTFRSSWAYSRAPPFRIRNCGRDASFSVKACQARLGTGMSARGATAVPVESLTFVLGRAVAMLVHVPHAILGVGVNQIRNRAKVPDRNAEIAPLPCRKTIGPKVASCGKTPVNDQLQIGPSYRFQSGSLI